MENRNENGYDLDAPRIVTLSRLFARAEVSTVCDAVNETLFRLDVYAGVTHGELILADVADALKARVGSREHGALTARRF